jgi:hypothetical protein
MRGSVALGVFVLFTSALFASCGGSEFSSDEGADSGTGGTPGCGPGQKRCGGQCVSREDETVGCGADTCSPCFLPQATAYVCQDGACVAQACEPGFDQCDSTPDCENIQTHDNCGSCGKACAVEEVCDSGSCTGECPSGKQDCGGACADVQTDISNCGSCGNTCVADNAQVSCSGGLCNFSCKSGFDDCDGFEATGCEVHLLSDPGHCGDCQIACDGAQGQVCDNGSCTCGAPLLSCPPTPECVDPSSDPQHCGGCTSCEPKEFCKAGGCNVPNCAYGLDMCQGICVNLQTDPANCGICQQSCTTAQTCVDGKCQNTCVTTQLCGLLCTSFEWDPRHCGACNNRCNPGQACIQGGCIDAVVASHASDCPEQACAIPNWWTPPNGVNFICLTQGQVCPL